MTDLCREPPVAACSARMMPGKERPPIAKLPILRKCRRDRWSQKSFDDWSTIESITNPCVGLSSGTMACCCSAKLISPYGVLPQLRVIRSSLLSTDVYSSLQTSAATVFQSLRGKAVVFGREFRWQDQFRSGRKWWPPNRLELLGWLPGRRPCDH